MAWRHVMVCVGSHLDRRSAVSLTSSVLQGSQRAWQVNALCNAARQDAAARRPHVSPERLAFSSSIVRTPHHGALASAVAASACHGRVLAVSLPEVSTPLRWHLTRAGTHSEKRGLQLTAGRAAAQALSAAQRCHGANGRSMAGIILDRSRFLLGDTSSSGRGCSSGSKTRSKRRHCSQGAPTGPGRGTQLSAVVQETATADDVKAPAVSKSSIDEQSPVGASAAEVAECGEHTGDTDDDEAAVGVHAVPCYHGEHPLFGAWSCCSSCTVAYCRFTRQLRPSRLFHTARSLVRVSAMSRQETTAEPHS